MLHPKHNLHQPGTYWVYILGGVSFKLVLETNLSNIHLHDFYKQNVKVLTKVAELLKLSGP